jgi:hypothetical protein
MQFDIILTPRFSRDSTLARISSGQGLEQFTRSYPINIVPPTDNSPFFFQALKLRNLLSWNRSMPERGPIRSNLVAVFVLVTLLIIVIVLTFLCIIVPLLLTTEKSGLKGALPHFLFFSGIGLGFMFVEISQMQLLIVFLGHPTYSLSVVLFSLLLSSSIGSYLTQRIESSRSAILRLMILLTTLIIFGSITSFIIGLFQSATMPVRIVLSIVILFPLGLTMGMAFPLGISFATKNIPGITPWLWGINGAMSVLASVLAVVIALSLGISASYWAGVFCYAAAVCAFVVTAKKIERLVVA